MPTLTKPTLGTSKKDGWQFYSLHMTSSLILRDYFNVSNYRESVELTKLCSTNLQRVLSENPDADISNRGHAIKKSQELNNWATEMQDQNYHELYVHAFISIWSSFEAGIENICADFLLNDKDSAETVASLFKPGKIGETQFPWKKETCLRIAGMLENKASNTSPAAKKDLVSRYKVLFDWFGVKIELDTIHSENLAEANNVRNILLHRYGQITEKDALQFPRLAQWQGEDMPFSRELFDRYHSSISKFLVVLMQGIVARKGGN